MGEVGNEGQGPEEEPVLKWLDIEDAYAKVYQKGVHADEFIDTDSETERLRIYLRYKPYNLLIGRPQFPESSPGILFWIQITAPPERTDISRQLYAALDEDDRLFVLRNDILENAGWRKTEEVLKMIREGHLMPFSEFTDDD